MKVNAFWLTVRIYSQQIDFFNKIFEAYDNLVVVTTIDAKEGLLLLRGFGKVSTVRRLLKGLPIEVEICNETQKEVDLRQEKRVITGI